jgi:protein transport protein SEC23|tara:strand:+ start:3151 stop:3261 length:111 start_codon:yes stop_codon:yes gene_type:complete
MGGFGENGQAGAEIIFTDDISLNVFLAHLAKLAVQS